MYLLRRSIEVILIGMLSLLSMHKCAIIGSTSQEAFSRGGNDSHLYLNTNRPALHNGTVTNWSYCYYGPSDKNHDNRYIASFAVYSRDGTDSQYVKASETLTISVTDNELGSFKGADIVCNVLSPNITITVRIGDVLGACVQNLSSTEDCNIIGEESEGHSLLRTTNNVCSDGQDGITLPMTVALVALDNVSSSILHLFGNITDSETQTTASTIMLSTESNGNTNSDTGFEIGLLAIIVIAVISLCVILFVSLVIVATANFIRKWKRKARSNSKGPSHQRTLQPVVQSQESSSVRTSVRNSITHSPTTRHSSSLRTSDTTARTVQASFQTVAEQSTRSVAGYGFSNSLTVLNVRVSTTSNIDENAHGSHILNDNYHVVNNSLDTDPASKPTQQAVYDEPALDDNNDPTSYYLLGQSINDSIYSYARIVEENKQQDIYKSVRPYRCPSQQESEIYTHLKSFGICNISHRKIRTTGHLGSGQFGNVEKGLWKSGMSDSDIEVALKTLYIGSSKADKVKFLQEAAIMAQFRHPNVILLFGVIIKGEPMTIVVELAHKGDLRKYLNNMNPNPTKRISANLLLNFSQQIALGMQYLAGKGFVHRDLAARNILLSKDNVCKIADFGMARDLADEEYYISRGGKIPVKWTAPEAIDYKKYSTASDVWSYGCLLYEIWSLGKKPFNTLRNLTVVKLLGKGMRLPPPPGCPELIYDLMIKCWHPDKNQRPRFRKVFLSLVGNEKALLSIPRNALASHKHAGVLGAPVEAGERMYLGLRRTYETSDFDYTSIPSNSNHDDYY